MDYIITRIGPTNSEALVMSYWSVYTENGKRFALIVVVSRPCRFHLVLFARYKCLGFHIICRNPFSKHFYLYIDRPGSCDSHEAGSACHGESIENDKPTTA